ncbi:hypothetical protein ACFLWG_02905 [Chloroflexota bacterium]
MNGQFLAGQLTYVITNDGQIQIMDQDTRQVIDIDIDIDIDANTELPTSLGWEDIVGKDVEIVAIDGKAMSVGLIERWRAYYAHLLPPACHQLCPLFDNFGNSVPDYCS